jgi:hypothetical protein
MFSIYVRALLAIIVFCPPVFSQEDMTEVVKKLAGETQRTWTLQGVEIYTGQKETCRGQSLTFYQDYRILIKRCVRGVRVTEQKSWSVKRISSLDIALKIGEKQYILLFIPLQRKALREEMRLRVKAQKPIYPTTDIIYYRKVD